MPCFHGPVVTPLVRIGNTIGDGRPHVSEVACFVGPFATRAKGGARGGLQEAPGSPEVARRLPEGPILIRTVKYVVSEAQVRQNVVNLRISEGVPGGTPEDPM